MCCTSKLKPGIWGRSEGRQLTLQAYHESGGVEGAIAKRAQAIYDKLTAEQREIAHRILLRLIELGEGPDDAHLRREVKTTELITTKGDELVIEEFVAARLLTASSKPHSRKRWIEISHEALLHGWPQLRRWLDEDRERQERAERQRWHRRWILAVSALMIISAITSWVAWRQNEARKEIGRQADKAQATADFLYDVLVDANPGADIGRDTTILQEVLNNAAARVGADLEANPAVAAKLYTTIAWSYLKALDDYEQAGSIAEDAESQLRSAGIDLSTVGSLQHLRKELLRRSRQPQAEVFLTKAIELYRKRPHSIELAQTLSDRGRFWLDVRATENAGRDLDEAISIASELHKTVSSRAAARAAKTHAEALIHKAEYASSPESREELRKKAVDLQVSYSRRGSNKGVATSSSQGEVLWQLGLLDEATDLFREDLKDKEKHYTPDHWVVETARDRLARALEAPREMSGADPTEAAGAAAKRRLEEAEVWRRMSYDLAKKDQRPVGQKLEKLAELVARRGEFEAAAELWSDVPVDLWTGVLVGNAPRDNGAALSAMKRAALLLENADESGYRKCRNQLLSQSGRIRSDDFITAERVLKTCLLRPFDEKDGKAIEHLTEITAKWRKMRCCGLGIISLLDGGSIAEASSMIRSSFVLVRTAMRVNRVK